MILNPSVRFTPIKSVAILSSIGNGIRTSISWPLSSCVLAGQTLLAKNGVAEGVREAGRIAR
jgi:hypothetical protein